MLTKNHLLTYQMSSAHTAWSWPSIVIDWFRSIRRAHRKPVNNMKINKNSLWASFLWMPAAFNSSKVNPRPSRVLMLYRTVGHRTTGRRVSVGRGWTRAALAKRARARLRLRIGWSNQHRMYFCQSLCRWLLGMEFLPLITIVVD